ncbi:hypothetical protein P5G51_015295 [Virgibacillus sp. 179-BFC.A HS]|uniref:GGDEF domain-containing protein n=1 Tax=Tigheibacillus jepli TaxID=3035914 RepID=A0ABU5CJK3_9BACI|nr:hypothetical protein [Virgibacillus sp. 179-BFC.A HS]MDY0406547.1 hypothetical protein [Virgibacillus sp. 179-BFC.A HS]
MRHNFFAGIFILLLLTSGWFFVFLELPLFQVGLIIGISSLLIMPLLRDRFVFLYAIAAILIYGFFLAIWLFKMHGSAGMQLDYIYNHLLFTSFILLYWLLLQHMKQTGYENASLKKQVALLQKYNKQTHILTFHEFLDQAKWTLRSVERNNSQAWLVCLDITYRHPYIEKNLQETVESIVAEAIRSQFDLATSTTGRVYILLRDTDETGVDIVLGRIMDKTKQRMNMIVPIYHVSKRLIENENELKQVAIK